MQQIQQFDPTAVTNGTFNLPLPNGGWLVLMNESVVGLLLEFGDGSTALVNPFTIRAMRVGARQSQCAWKQQYLITGGQAPTGLNLVTGEAYDPATWTGGEFILALPRMVNVGNQTGSGSLAELVNDGNPANTTIIESTAQGSTGSNVLVTNDGAVTVKVLSSGAYTPALTITPGGASAPMSVALHGNADSASSVPEIVSGGNAHIVAGSRTLTYDTGGGISTDLGGNFRAISQISGNGSATVSLSGWAITPNAVLVNTKNGSNSTTFGSGSYTTASVFVYQFSGQPWVGIVVG